MFKIDDIIVRKDGMGGRYRIVEFRYTDMIVENDTNDRSQLARYTITMGDKLCDIWEVDKTYNRKQKLKKICSKLVI
jgi:hypothetical protein